MREGASLLRRLRLAAGLTQEQLAELAGVHERTVRGLEGGGVTTPRRITLDLLARALGLGVGDHTRFRASWGIHDLGPTGGEATGAPESSQTAIEKILVRSTSMTLATALSESLVFGADRRRLRRRTEEVLVALEDGVTSRAVIYDPEEEPVDITRLHLSDLENGKVVHEQVDEPSRTKLFDVDLGRTLSRGDTHVLRYTLDFAAARSRAGQSLTMRCHEIGGFVRSPSLFLLEVRFHADAIPSRCEQVFQPRPQSPVQTTRSLTLSDAHVAHVALINPKPGGHGIAWEW